VGVDVALEALPFPPTVAIPVNGCACAIPVARAHAGPVGARRRTRPLSTRVDDTGNSIPVKKPFKKDGVAVGWLNDRFVAPEARSERCPTPMSSRMISFQEHGGGRADEAVRRPLTPVRTRPETTADAAHLQTGARIQRQRSESLSPLAARTRLRR